MKALLKARPEPELWLEDVAEPRLGINDVLVRINRTGICGTDLSIFNWDAWAQETIPVPMVVGHEFVGEVVETGSNEAIFRARSSAVKAMSSAAPAGIASPGAGPIGAMAVAVARHAGARYVVATDVNPYRMELARQMGATLVLDARTERVADAQKKLGMVEGFDVGLEMSGNDRAFQEMLDNMCHGGKVAMLGIPKEKMTMDWNTVVFNMLTIKGIYGREMYETWYKMTVMLQSGLDIEAGHHPPVPLFGIPQGLRDHAIG